MAQPKKHTLDLSMRPFKLDELQRVLSAARDGVATLSLARAELRWADCGKIAETLAVFPQLRVHVLDVSGNAIGPEGMAALCKAKGLWEHLLELYASDCLVESDGAAAVAVAVRDSRLVKLDLSGNLLGSYGVGAFALLGLEGNVSLQSLVLERNNIEDAGVVAMTTALSFHQSLTELSMADNAISVRGAAALAEALSCDEQRIQRLNIARNNIGKKGAFETAAVLVGNKTLLELDVSSNTLGGSQMDSVLVLSKEQDGVAALGESLRKNKSLLSLKLEGNNLGVVATVGMKAMGGALALNTTLCRLTFDPTDSIDLLEPGLKKNNSLAGSMGCEVPKEIAALLARNDKTRIAFEALVKKGPTLAKVKEVVDKGVDILSIEPEFLFKHSTAELIVYYHSLLHVRNHLYSSPRVLDALFSFPPKVLKELAKQPVALLFAIRMRHSEAVTSLLKHGADPNKPDEMDRTALHMAVELGYEELVAILFQYRANPDIAYCGMPLLALAASNGHAGVLQFLVKKLPKLLHVCTPAPKSRSLLHVAARSGRAQVVAVLLVMGLDPNKPSGDGLVPFHVASSAEVCKLLLEAGANVRALAPDGRDVLYYHLFPAGKAPVGLDVATFFLENDPAFFFEPREGPHKPTVELVTELDVRNGFRDNLPVWLGKLPNLASLKAVEGNNLRSIPKNALEEGDEGVLRYLKDIGVGSKDIWQGFKILVLGKEGVGKTHIFHLASGGIYQRNVSTDGIDIHRFALGKEKVPVTWFDFGGQEVFYPTHELFLTGQCVYLLAFNMDDAEFEQRVSYWLRVVHSFSHDKAKVLIVGTHKDTLKNGDKDVEMIHKRICEMTASNTEVVDKIYMSCLDDPKKVGALIANALLAAAQQAKLGGKEVPHIYTVINDWITDQRSRENARPYFLWDEFLEHFPGYDGALLERACDFLHDMGSLFIAKRFVRDKKANLICIDIQWLARAFSAVITFRHNWIKNGVLHQTALSHIWRDFGIVHVHDMLAIMSLFEKFNIAFARRQEGVWVIPSMLKVEPPDAIGEITQELTHARLYKMSVLPSGVFGQIIARVSDWQGVEMTEIWRYGMVVRDALDMVCMTVEGGCEIHLLVFHRDDAEPEEVELAEKKGGESLLRRIDEELQAAFRLAFRSMEKLPVEILIMCPHCISNGVGQEECNWLAYEQVVSMVLSGVLSFECMGEESSLAALGEDVTMGYAKTFKNDEIKIDSQPLIRGESGAIYRGVLTGNGGTGKVVVKELTVDSTTEVMEWFGTFQREVSQMMRLRHPNLVHMHGIMLGPLRIILEFCGDGDLQGVLKRRKVKGKALKTRLASDIAKAMEFLHSLDPPLAHRDLRSSNVLLVSCTATSKEAVAKVKLAESGVTKASAASLSSNWQWMAPEAMFGQTPPETCDLYSYAMILWEIWTGTGETPFETMISQNPGQKPEDFMRSIAQSNLRPVINSTWDVAELLVFLWDKNVHARPSFATCVELISDIQAGKVEDLGEKLRRDKAARAAAASVASIAPASSSDGAPSIFAEADDNPLRRLSRMTVAPGRGMTNAMAPQMMPCKFGANCQIMDCRFDHSKARSETAIAEALVDEIFATGDSFEPPPSMLPVVIPALQAPATRGSGGFKSGWEEEILQKAAAAKRAVEAQAKAAVDVEPTISTFGPGWEEEILKRAAARKAAEEERAKAAEAPAKATFVKARPSRAASDAREHNNSSPREAEEGSSGGLKGFLRGNRSRANSQDVSPRASPRASPRDEAGVSPQPSPRVVAAASAAPTTKAPSAPPGRVKSMGMEKPLPMPPGGLGQSPRAPTVAAPPAPIPGDDSGETRGRNRSSVVRMQPLSGSGDLPRKISPRVSAAARDETSPSAPREVRKPLPMPSRPAGCEVKRDSLRALPAALKRGSGAPSTVAPMPKAKPVAEAAEQWE